MSCEKLLAFICLLCSPSFAGALDYFWVGGEGKWTDISHWATTSGGTGKHFQLPTSNDDVHFDENSFSNQGEEFLINVGEIVCRNMNWLNVTNTPVFKAAEHVKLNIFGDLTLSPTLEMQVGGQFVFKSSSANNVIRTFGATIDQLSFDGLGTWLFSDDINVAGSIFLVEGHLDFNGNEIRCDELISNSKEIRTLSLQNAYLNAHKIHIDLSNLDFKGENAVVELDGEGSNFVLTGFGDAEIGSVRFLAHDAVSHFEISTIQSTIHINDLTSEGDLNLSGNANIDKVFLEKGRSYQLGPNSKLSIKTLASDADCQNRVFIFSEDLSTRASIIGLSNLTSDFIDFQAIKCDQCAELLIPNALDLGGNMGLDFNFHAKQDFYWIGADGSWSDPINWATSSGGSSVGCAPSSNDNVFFDENSFSIENQLLEIDVPSAYANNISWRNVKDGSGIRGTADKEIVVFGSLELAENMNHDFDGDYTFKARNVSSIVSNNIAFKGNLVFKNLDGYNYNFNGSNTYSWTLLDNLTCQKEIKLRSGSIRAEEIEIRSNRFSASGDGRMALVFKNSVHTLFPTTTSPAVWETYRDFRYLSEGSEIRFQGGDTAYFINEFGDSEAVSGQYNKILFEDVDADINVEFGALYCDELALGQNAVFAGFFTAELLRLSAGNKYEFFASQGAGGSQIGDIEHNSDCSEGMIKIFSSRIGIAAKLFLAQEVTVSHFDISDISILGSGSLLAEQSFDGGRNMNIDFASYSARDLYWVGNGGEWFDNKHWSYVSGGSGGVCPPNISDNVFFDKNSFSLPDQEVINSSSNVASCKQISWLATLGMPVLKMRELWASGSVLLDNSFTYSIEHLFLTSAENVNITTEGQDLKSIIVKGYGIFNFLNDLVGRELIQYSGTCNLENLNIDLDKIYLFLEAEKFNIKQSVVNLSGGNYPKLSSYRSVKNGGRYYPFYSSAKSKTIEAENSLLNFSSESAGIFMSKTSNLGNVNFASSTGDIRIETPFGSDFKTVKLSASASFSGEMVYDSILFSPGMNYLFDERILFDVNSYFQMVGHNCAPINFYNNEADKTELTFQAACMVIADFVLMQNIHNLSSTRFAGSYSTNVDNSNSGWTFEEASDDIESGFLGSDRVLCEDEGILLAPYKYIENTTILWNDGSNDNTLSIDEAGLYSASVIVNELCKITDSIEVFNSEDFDLGLDSMLNLCEGGTTEITTLIQDGNADFLWSNGSTENKIQVADSGLYSLIVSLNDCIFFDSTLVIEVPIPFLNLGDDLTICEGEFIVLRPETIGIFDEMLWLDTIVSDSFYVDQPGIYWVSVEENGCKATDTLDLSITSLPSLNIEGDSMVCAHDSLVLMAEYIEGASYLWNDGSTGLAIDAFESGIYSLYVEYLACTLIETFNIEVAPSPTVNLGDDLSLCVGDLVYLEVADISSDFIWDDGSADLDREIMEGGIYWIEVENDFCVSRDSVEISFSDPPLLDLGQDTSICEKLAFTIVPNTVGLTPTWSDGSEATSFVVQEEGTYFAMIENGACTVVDSISVIFKECSEFEVFIPNAFSPNNDGDNDFFEVFVPIDIVLQNFEMEIFDRWGNRVFRSDSPSERWDGTTVNRTLPTGVYSVMISLDYKDDFTSSSLILRKDVAILR